MKKIGLVCIILLPLYWACSNNEQTSEKPENDVDAARMFIRDALDGKYKDARNLIVPDSANMEWMDNIERSNTQSLNVTDQRGYRESQITIHDTRKINDSATVIIYSNTFKNQRDSVKVIRVNDNWLVDLKYSFPNNNVIEK